MSTRVYKPIKLTSSSFGVSGSALSEIKEDIKRIEEKIDDLK